METREQRAFLQSAQCGKLQGYLFSPPVPPDKMERLLRAARIEPAAPSDEHDTARGVRTEQSGRNA